MDVSGAAASESRPAAYREAHSALNVPLLACGLFGPAAAEIAFVLLAVLVNPQWFVAVGLLPLALPVMVYSGLLYRNWPTGIQIDGAAISIGAIGSARAARRTPTVNHQAWGLFTCPWPDVNGVRVVTDRAELRRVRKSPSYFTFTNRWGGKRGQPTCHIGVLASPFMQAALVIDVDTLAVTSPSVRPARYFNNFKNGYYSRQIQPELSPTWIVPTRHPQALSQALQAIPSYQGPARSQ